MAEEEKIDVGDPKQVKKRKTKAQLVQEEQAEQLRGILATYGGRAFIWRLLSSCGMHHAAVGGTNDVFRSEGRRDVGLELEEEVWTVHPEMYILMMNDAISRDTKTREKG